MFFTADDESLHRKGMVNFCYVHVQMLQNCHRSCRLILGVLQTFAMKVGDEAAGLVVGPVPVHGTHLFVSVDEDDSMVGKEQHVFYLLLWMHPAECELDEEVVVLRIDCIGTLCKVLVPNLIEQLLIIEFHVGRVALDRVSRLSYAFNEQNLFARDVAPNAETLGIERFCNQLVTILVAAVEVQDDEVDVVLDLDEAPGSVRDLLLTNLKIPTDSQTWTLASKFAAKQHLPFWLAWAQPKTFHADTRRCLGKKWVSTTAKSEDGLLVRNVSLSPGMK